MLTQVNIDNFKGIRRTNFTCKQITLLVGENRQGKTSALRSIEWALGAKTGGLIINNNAGQADEARVRMETDKGLTIERKLKNGAKKNLLAIHRPDGELVADPEQLLGKVFNPMAFDPIRLIMMDGKTQASVVRDALASSMSLTDDEIKVIESFGGSFDKTKPVKEQLEASYKKFYDERTGINRVVKTLKEKAKGSSIKTIPTDTEIATATKLMKIAEDEYSDALKNNARIEAFKKNQEQRVRLEGMISELDIELKGAEVSADEKALSDKLTDLESNFKKASAEEAEVRGAIRQIEAVLLNLGESKYPVCPISKKISCSTDIGDTKDSLAKELKTSKTKVKKMFDDNKDKLDEITELKRQLEIVKRIGPKKIERERMKSTLESLGGSSTEQPIDIVPLKVNLDEMRDTLSELKAAKEIGDSGDLDKHEVESVRLDKLVNYLKQLQEVDLPKRMELGMTDLKLESDGLYYKGIALQDECTSLQLRLASALVRKLYPNSKILTIDRMEVLSEKTLLGFLDANSRDTNFQIIGTYVGTPPPQLKNMNNVKLVYMEKGEADA